MKTAQYKQIGHTVSPVIGVGIGIGMSLVLSFLLSAVTAWLVGGGQLPQNATSSMSIPIQGIAAFVGCITAMLLTGNMPAVIAAICAGGYFVILVCINVLVMNSSLGGVGKGFASILGGAVLAVGVCILGKGNKKPKRRRIR